MFTVSSKKIWVTFRVVLGDVIVFEVELQDSLAEAELLLECIPKCNLGTKKNPSENDIIMI